MELARYIIVVAGGRGTRMGSDTPKQFLPLAGSIVLMHTLERMAAADDEIAAEIRAGFNR